MLDTISGYKAFIPKNYNFELEKTIHRIINNKKPDQLICLQFPEGLLMYASLIVNIIQHITKQRVLIMGDVTYGACCIDDIQAKALKADLLVHYGHSCLVPIT